MNASGKVAFAVTAIGPSARFVATASLAVIAYPAESVLS
jgi:hypothetical protein